MSLFKQSILTDRLNNEVEVGLFGELKTSNPVPQISETFDIPINPNRLKVVGIAEAQFRRSQLKVSQNSSVTTVSTLVYKTAQTIEAYFTAGFHGSFASGESYIGLFDEYDGVFVGYKNGNFVCGYRNVFASENASWNGSEVVNTTPDVLQEIQEPANIETLTRYRIKLGYLGIGNISYEYFNGKEWVLIHLFETDNALFLRTHIGSAILPMRSQVENTEGCFIVSGSWNAQTWGLDQGLQDQVNYSRGSRTITPSTVGVPLVAFRSKGTFGNYPSKIKSRLIKAGFLSLNVGLLSIDFWAYPAGTIAGASTFQDVNANTALQQSTNLIGTDIEGGLASGVLLFSRDFFVSSGQGQQIFSDGSDIDFQRLGLIARPKDEFVIAIRQISGTPTSNITTWSIAYEDLL
jgi:hypothetical protein